MLILHVTSSRFCVCLYFLNICQFTSERTVLGHRNGSYPRDECPSSVERNTPNSGPLPIGSSNTSPGPLEEITRPDPLPTGKSLYDTQEAFHTASTPTLRGPLYITGKPHHPVGPDRSEQWATPRTASEDSSTMQGRNERQTQRLHDRRPKSRGRGQSSTEGGGRQLGGGSTNEAGGGNTTPLGREGLGWGRGNYPNDTRRPTLVHTAAQDSVHANRLNASLKATQEVHRNKMAQHCLQSWEESELTMDHGPPPKLAVETRENRMELLAQEQTTPQEHNRRTHTTRPTARPLM